MHNFQTQVHRLSILMLLICSVGISEAADRPNVVVVLFDDLGWGQFRGLVGESEFPMPHLERLAAEGMSFTDAHAAAAVCTPTRYGLLTGRYPCRIGQFGVLTTWSAPIIPRERLTIAGMLQSSGYRTACIGKWHLGLVWENGKPGKQDRVPIGERLNVSPRSNGFDYFYGFTHARNFGTIIEQEEVVEHVEDVDNQPRMIAKTVEFIQQQEDSDQPFFLYFPMCPPHKPIVPASQYVGKSGAADVVGKDPLYGDWILQGDDMLGQILAALEETGQAENTIVFAASDNGAERRPYQPLRDSKRSIYEGGHRVPFVVRWPGRIRAASICDTTICLNDVFATTAEIIGFELPDDAAEDSTSLVNLLLEKAENSPDRVTVHQSNKGDLAIRSQQWKMIFHRNGQRELFDLHSDLSEKADVIGHHSDIAEELTRRMQQLIDRGRNSPGSVQTNEHGLSLTPKTSENKSRGQ